MTKETKFEKGLKKAWKNIIFNLIFVVLTLLILILFHKNILLAVILLIVVTIIWFIKWNSKLTIAIFIVGVLIGPIYEIVAISFGIWSYAESNIINIPLWLFILWGDAAAFLYQMAVEIKKFGVKK